MSFQHRLEVGTAAADGLLTRTRRNNCIVCM